MNILYDITTLASLHAAKVTPGGIYHHTERLGLALASTPRLNVHVGARGGQEANARNYVASEGKFRDHQRCLAEVGFEKQAKLAEAKIVHVNWRGADTIPNIKGCRTVFTLPDVIAIKSPHYFVKPGEANPAADYITRILKSVDKRHSICVSTKKVKRDVLKLFGHISSEQLHVLPLGQNVSEIESDKADPNLKDRLLKSSTYKVLCTNTIEPRKNMALVLRCAEWLAVNSPQSRIEFFLVGAQGWLNEEWDKVFSGLSPAARKMVSLMGYVDDQDLALLRQECDLFVFPSFDEGFGLPILEAMAAGMPVVTTIAQACVEAGGGFAHTVNGNSESELAEKILGLMSKSISTDVTKSMEYAQGRTWAHVASDFSKFYEKIIG